MSFQKKSIIHAIYRKFLTIYYFDTSIISKKKNTQVYPVRCKHAGILVRDSLGHIFLPGLDMQEGRAYESI